MLTHFVIDCGYVESGSNASVLMCHSVGFNTVEEAAEHIRAAILGLIRESRKKRHCCKKTEEDVSKAEYCFACGRRLDSDPDYYLNERSAEQYQNFHHGQIDGNHDIITAFEQAGWQMWRNPNETNEWTAIHHFDRWLEDYPDWDYSFGD
jgi:hypothetical protein